MPLNKASCIPLVSMVPHGGQIRHYTAWYFWSDPTLHYVIFLVRSDTTIRGISGQIRLYTTWYFWSDRRVVGKETRLAAHYGITIGPIEEESNPGPSTY